MAGVLVALAALSCALHLAAESRGLKAFTYVFKPLTTSILIVLALTLPKADRAYGGWIVAGLIASLAGDVFLMLPRDRFVAGLASFLLAHLAYLGAFTRGASLGERPLLLVPYALAAAVVLRRLWPNLNGLRVPVVIYVVALMVMAWQAWTRAAMIGTSAAWAAAAGAALFVASDATLALNRFARTFRAAQVVVMTTYVAAQTLIALSVAR